jgi:ABC-2 type transport system permease protein
MEGDEPKTIKLAARGPGEVTAEMIEADPSITILNRDVVIATLTGLRSFRALDAEQSAAQAAMRGFWVDQGAKNPHSAAHYGLWVFKPKMPLSFIDQGVDSFTGVTTWLEAHKQNEFTRRPAMDQASVP